MTDLDLFRAIGAALYGPEWQSELARRLDVNLTTLRRWATGKFAIPAGIWADLVPLIDAKQAELTGLRPSIADRASTSTSE